MSLHHVLGRVLNGSVHARPLQFRRIPFSPSILQRLKLRPQPRFFTSTAPKSRGRPYPHRAYYDYQKPPFLGFLDRIPQNAVFWGIITINGVVFVMWFLTKQRMTSEGVQAPYIWMRNNFRSSWFNVSQGRIWTPITAIFSHERVEHIFFNGFTFYFMAKPVLEFLGTRKFLFLYMGGGLFSSVSSMVWHNLIEQYDVSSMGASGAIYSVVSLLAGLAPRATFMLYGLVPIPAWLAVSGVFAYDTFSALYGKRQEVDTVGHISGLLVGIAYSLVLRFRMF